MSIKSKFCFLIITTILSMTPMLGKNINPESTPLAKYKTKTIQTATYRPLGEYKVHAVGTLWSTVSNFGTYGSPQQDSPSMEWPGGSNLNYLWSGSFWAAGVVDGETRCSNNSFFTRGWNPGEGSSFSMGTGKSIEDHFVIFDDLVPAETQRRFGEAHYPLGIEVRERGLTWSLEDYDDFIVYEYEVENVSRNVINNFYVGWLYDFDISINPDTPDSYLDDLVDYEGWDGKDTDSDRLDIVDPLDLDGDGETGYDKWGWPFALPMNRRGASSNPNYAEEKIEPDGFFDEWQIMLDANGPVIHWQTNRNSVQMPAGSPAVVNDDTLRGYLISRNASYMFDHDFLETPQQDIGERENFHPVPGFVFGRLLYSDIIREMDVFPYRTSAEDTFMRPYSHQWWSSTPNYDSEQYQYMAATNEASTKFGKNYHFMPLPFEVMSPVFDYRFLQSTGPFPRFIPGQVLRFVFVVGVGKGFQGMRENMDHAMQAYYTGSIRSNPYQPSAPDFRDPDGDYHWLLAAPPPIPLLKYSAKDEGVLLTWDNQAESVIDPVILENDFAGYKIYRATYHPQNWKMIAAFDVVNEAVLVENSDGEIINAKRDLATGNILTWGQPGYDALENFEYIKEDLPEIDNEYPDKGSAFLNRTISAPLNGIKYYYTVTAYDFPQPAVGARPAIRSQESPRSNYRKDPQNGNPLPVIPVKYYDDSANLQVEMANIKVVPNPYKGTSLLESFYEDKILFTNLPPACKISIFTLTGDLVDTIYHQDGTDTHSWNLISRVRLRAVSGLYIFVVEAEQPPYAKHIGKFVIIR